MSQCRQSEARPPSYLQGKELNELVQVFFILLTQATVHVCWTLQKGLHLNCHQRSLGKIPVHHRVHVTSIIIVYERCPRMDSPKYM